MRRILIATIALALVALFSASPARSETVARKDPKGDAASDRFDIRRAIYFNAPKYIGGRANVVDLRGKATYYAVRFSPRDNPDLVFTASTRRTSSGRTVNDLSVFNGDGETITIPCRLKARWELARDVIELKVARTCLEGTYGRLYMNLSLGRTARVVTQDHARGSVVMRG